MKMKPPDSFVATAAMDESTSTLARVVGAARRLMATGASVNESC
jgi:hypothetical protein